MFQVIIEDVKHKKSGSPIMDGGWPFCGAALLPKSLFFGQSV